jgi:uncharacterized membrane protein YeaQ/YmgE (transglycosylase-associated protein family)
MLCREAWEATGGRVGLLAWVVFGFLAGLLARALMPGKDPGGLVATTAIGIVGAVVGGWIGTRLGFGTVTGFDLRSLGVAVVGALVLLVGLRALRR